MIASIAATSPGFERSMPVGPPLHSTPSVPDRIPPVPVSGSDVDGSGGPTTHLSRCVGDADQFAAQYWGRRPLMHPARGRPGTGTGIDTFADVFSLEALDELVAQGSRLPAVRMIADGAALAPRSFCTATRLGGRDLDDVVDPAKVVARLADGATLVMQSLHRTSASVGAFVTQLQDELSHPVQANAYLTPPSAVGLAEHSDLHDVIAVQLHGSKGWWVDGLGDVTMLPGDVMYVPRGVRHRAETTADTSLHLTLGIIRVTARQVIDRILNTGPELLDDPLPIGYRHPARRDELELSLDTALEAALDLIGSTATDTVADHEQSRRLARPPIAGRISSNVRLNQLDADGVIRWIGREPLVRTVDETDGRLTVRLEDRILTVPIAALEALRVLSDGRPVCVGDLPGLDESSRVVLARRLVRETACIIEEFG